VKTVYIPLKTCNVLTRPGISGKPGVSWNCLVSTLETSHNQVMRTIVQVLYQNKIQIFQKQMNTSFANHFLFKRNYSRSLKRVHDLKPSYENPRCLAYSSKHKTLVHQEALWRYQLVAYWCSHDLKWYLLWLRGLSRNGVLCLCALFLSGLRGC
jgi:hypothetical protein